MAADLSKSLGVFKGTAILLNIVIGAGLLTLPGLAVEVAGGQATLAWALCGLAALPLLCVFIVLGRRYPDAGGVSAYAGRAFGPFGTRVAAVLFLGAVVFGLPSIALSGGHYLATVFGGSPHAFALALLVGAILPHLLPGQGAGRVMAAVASAVLAAIVAFLAIGFAGMGASSAAAADAGPGGLSAAFAPFTMLFFAFTGWEVGAGIAEEFRRPQRDFPLAMVVSFAAASALYLAVAVVTARTNLGGQFATPFVAIVRPLLGAGGAGAVALTAALIVFANLSGAVWGVSRLVFGLAREGIVPRVLAATRGGRPLAAVVATVTVLVIVLAASAFGAFDLPAMLALAGQNFLILYGIAAAALVVLARRTSERVLGAAVIALVTLLVMLQGARLAYPLVLVGLAAMAEAARSLGPAARRAGTALGLDRHA